MMIDDERRREVSKKMREYDVAEFRESAIVPFLECLGHGYMNWRGILDELADLIDRQACHDVGDGYTFRCSACGCELDEPTMWLGGSAMTPRHCPNCGAAVTERGGCDVRKL